MGFTAGAPVILPGYNGKNRTFWFFSFDQFYRRGGQLGGLHTLPTAQMQRGDFGELPRTLYDPATSRTGPGGIVRDPFPNQIIPQSRFSSVSASMLQFHPTPALPGVVNNNPEPLSSPFADQRTWGFKLDHIISDKHRLSGMYNSTDRPRRLSVEGRVIAVGDETALSSFNDQRVGTKVARINLNSTLSPTWLNHLGLGYGLFHNPNQSIAFGQGWTQPNGGRLGLTGLQFDMFPRVTFATDGYASYGHATASDNRFHTFTLMDTVSVIKGNHTIKFGGEVEGHRDNYRNFGNGAGTFQFRRDTTGLPGTANSGDAFGAFLLGETFSSSAFFRDSIPGGRYTNTGVFIDDQWRVNDRLTLNMGFRWEMIVPHSDPVGRLSYMDIGVNNPSAGNLPGAMVYGGAEGFGNRFLDILKWNPAPRFGFAYKLGNDMVVRGGVGIFNSNYINQGLGLPQFGFGTTASFVSGDGGITPAFNWDNGFPQDFRRPPITEIDAANGQNVTAVLPSDFTLPRKLQWNLLIEKQFGSDLSLSFGYVANKGTYLYEQQQINQIPDGATQRPVNVLRAPINSPLALANGVVEPFAGFAELWGGRATVAQALRPFPQFGNVGIYGSTYGNSNYHSFQHKLDKRYRGGLSGTLAYTWSKFLTDARQFDGLSGQQNQYLREKSYHPTDLTHILTFSMLYEMPFGQNKRFLSEARGVAGKLVEGWQISAVNSYSSGTRLPVITNNPLPFFNLALRPNLVSEDIRSNVPMGSFDPATDVYLNRAAFAQPGAGQYGNAPRYLTQRGPMRSDESMGIFKNTRINERITHQFRMEVVNPLNRVVFGNPITNFAAGNFGQIASTQVSPRNVQFGMKLIW